MSASFAIQTLKLFRHNYSIKSFSLLKESHWNLTHNFKLSTSSFKTKSRNDSIKKPFTPVGKFDLEDEAKKKELDQIRFSL